MTGEILLLVPLIFLITLPHFLAFVAAETLHGCNTTYSTNLDAALSILPTNMDRSGFYYNSAGQIPDRANVIALCRGDVEVAVCRKCVQGATADIRNSTCSDQKNETKWYDHGTCMVRHSNKTILRAPDNKPIFWAWSAFNASSPNQFEQDLRSLLDDIRTQASNGGSLRKFAAGNVTGLNFQKIYALVQCTPDLYPEDCENCLICAARRIPQCCDKKRGGTILLTSCCLRFETYPFFSESTLRAQEPRTPPASPPVPPEPPMLSPRGRSNKPRVIIIVPVSIAVCVMVMVFVGILLRRRRKLKSTGMLETVDQISTVESLQYSFSTIRAATDNFSNDQKLGQGGFGVVYKGILPNKQKIAIKRLSKDSTQGSLEFKNEVLLLTRLQHRNLVKLLGFSIEGTEKIIVYEYIPKGSLDNYICEAVEPLCLNWETRYKIISGIAKGLLYLHENSRLKIIHRDIKPNNILLDEEMNPKIADFGLAKLFEQDKTGETTGRIVGTYGYMPPEYARNGQFSVKSDVYSYGVVLLEIIHARKNNNHFQSGDNEIGIVSFAWENWRDGKSVNIVDPFLRSSPRYMNDILRCIHIGLLCCQRDASKRPTIASVVLMLGNLSTTLPVPCEPAFYFNASKNRKTAQSGEHMSKNDATITELHPR